MLQKLKYSFLKVMQSLRVFFRFFQNWLMFLSTFFLSIISASVLPLFSLFLSLKCWIEKTQWRNQLICLLRLPWIFIKFIYTSTFFSIFKFEMLNWKNTMKESVDSPLETTFDLHKVHIFEIFYTLQIQKRTVLTKTIRGNTVYMNIALHLSWINCKHMHMCFQSHAHICCALRARLLVTR